MKAEVKPIVFLTGETVGDEGTYRSFNHPHLNEVRVGARVRRLPPCAECGLPISYWRALESPRRRGAASRASRPR